MPPVKNPEMRSLWMKENNRKNDEGFNQKWREALENAKVKKCSGEGVVGSARKKILDLWRDLLESPKQWWDYRGQKSNGLVKEKCPDFRHKESRDALWDDSALDWALTEVGKLEFDVKFMIAKPAPGGEEGLGERKEFGVASGKTQSKVAKGKFLRRTWWRILIIGGIIDLRRETRGSLILSNSPDWLMSRLSEGKKTMEAL